MAIPSSKTSAITTKDSILLSDQVLILCKEYFLQSLFIKLPVIMRLINTSTLEMNEFFNNIPPYAILSHTWGTEEVTYQEFQAHSAVSHKAGCIKIVRACEQARLDKLDWCWVDTCCIDKSSSAELSEAINSMFRYYQGSQICYAYLADISKVEELARSRWFTRGWTLQELLAPERVEFFLKTWALLGGRAQLCWTISSITRIRASYLMSPGSVFGANISQKMSWYGSQETTREEDTAYCLLGLFEINMPLLYGEGQRAFLRLQQEFIKQSDDRSIFCWDWNDAVPHNDWLSILAPHPAVFGTRASYFLDPRPRVPRPYQMTNSSLSIEFELIPTQNPKLCSCSP